MIDKLIKFRWWKVQLNNCLTYMSREKNINLIKKWLRYELLKIKFKCGHSKYHYYLPVKVFIITFLINVFILITYHILNLCKTFWDEMIMKCAFEWNCIFQIIIHISFSKVHSYMFCVYLLNFIIMYLCLFKLKFLIQYKKLYHINDFIIHL